LLDNIFLSIIISNDFFQKLKERCNVIMTKRKVAYLKDTEELILLAILGLQPNAYGVKLRQHVEEVTGHSISIGSIYTTLDGLEEAGYVKSKIGEATPERGGKRKWYYEVTGEGISALKETEKARIRLTGLQPGLSVS
jgi:PadR family transcriptional regulator, regulatory protein PadR